MKQARRIRKITCKGLDSLVRKRAHAKQDPMDRRWYLPVSDDEVTACEGNIKNAKAQVLFPTLNTVPLWAHYFLILYQPWHCFGSIHCTMFTGEAVFV